MTSSQRRENITRHFTPQTIAATLRRAAEIREQLAFSRHDLLLDPNGRPCHESEATQASTQGVIRLAVRELIPNDRYDARDLAWESASAFQKYIGHGIIAYDANAEIDARQIARDLRDCAQMTSSDAQSDGGRPRPD